MGIAPSSNHGANYSTLEEQGCLLQLLELGLVLWTLSSTNATDSQPGILNERNNSNSNNNPRTICNSQEVYIESLGLPYYALAAWVHLCLKTMIPVPTSGDSDIKIFGLGLGHLRKQQQQQQQPNRARWTLLLSGRLLLRRCWFLLLQGCSFGANCCLLLAENVDTAAGAAAAEHAGAAAGLAASKDDDIPPTQPTSAALL
eukprot:jgi/Psemu1/1504/gm1.1504_g